jgi:hypothetical protein
LLSFDDDLVRPMAVAEALRIWVSVATSAKPLEPDYPGPTLSQAASSARASLEAAGLALPPALRGEFTALVEPVDRLLLSKVATDGGRTDWWNGFFLD